MCASQELVCANCDRLHVCWTRIFNTRTWSVISLAGLILGPFPALINYDLKGKIGDSAWISEKFTAPENGSMCWKFIFSFSKCDPISRISRNLGIETWGLKFGLKKFFYF